MVAGEEESLDLTNKLSLQTPHVAERIVSDAILGDQMLSLHLGFLFAEAESTINQGVWISSEIKDGNLCIELGLYL